MKVAGIIPARLRASRFPNKPMELIEGIPIVGHCYYRTCIALGIDNTYVATCDDIIANYIRSIGGQVIMTSDTHTRATTRSAEALEIIESKSGERIDIVVMVQGDEPLILPNTIAETLVHFEDKAVEIVNVMSRLRTIEDFKDKNNVKVVFNINNDALYFSREPIPSTWKGLDTIPMFMQTGIIAFRRGALMEFNAARESILEQIESVDMNRVLEMGKSIRMVPTYAVTVGVDTPEDLLKAKLLMRDDEILQVYAH